MNLYVDDETSFSKSYFFLSSSSFCNATINTMMVTGERSDDADGDPLLQLHPRPQEAHNGLKGGLIIIIDICIIFITITTKIIIIHRKENIFDK